MWWEIQQLKTAFPWHIHAMDGTENIHSGVVLLFTSFAFYQNKKLGTMLLFVCSKSIK